MDLYQYRTFSIAERATLLWKEGAFIANAKQQSCAYSLYSFHGFYVEVEMNASEIVDVVPFKLGHRLEKYLDDIILTGD